MTACKDQIVRHSSDPGVIADAQDHLLIRAEVRDEFDHAAQLALPLSVRLERNRFGAHAVAPSFEVRQCNALPTDPETTVAQWLKRHGVHLADETGDKWCRGRGVQIPRRADLLDATLIHHHHAVGHAHRLFLIVRDQQRRHPKRELQAPQFGAQFHANFGVERRQRLVQQQHSRVRRERSSQCHTLALTAAERRDVALVIPDQPDDLQKLPDSSLKFSLVPARDPQPETDVARDGQVGEQRVILENHADLAVLSGNLCHVLRPNVDAARIRNLETRDHPQRRRLAATARAQQAQQLTRFHLEIHVLHRCFATVQFGQRRAGDADGLARGLRCASGHRRGHLVLLVGANCMFAPSTTRFIRR